MNNNLIDNQSQLSPETLSSANYYGLDTDTQTTIDDVTYPIVDAKHRIINYLGYPKRFQDNMDFRARTIAYCQGQILAEVKRTPTPLDKENIHSDPHEIFAPHQYLTFDSPIQHLADHRHVSQRYVNILKREGFAKVGELHGKSVKDLAAYKGISDVTAGIIFDVVSAMVQVEQEGKVYTPDEMIGNILAVCSQSPLDWFNIFAWTFDPRLTPEKQHTPFITYEFQDEFILDLVDAIENGHDVLNEKSRDMGATWMVLGVFVWGWLFKGWQLKVGSRTENLVDKIGDMDSLFERMRYMIRMLPQWMLPRDFEEHKHLSFMKIINPAFGNQILGESTNESFSRGGRYKAMLLDEFSMVDNRVADMIWKAAGDSSPCRVLISTPKGIANKFAQIRFEGKILVKTLHWTLHPKKAEGAYLVEDGTKLPFNRVHSLWRDNPKSVSSPWYEKEKARRSEIDIAQELDLDYLSSAGRCVFDREQLNDLIRNASNPIRTTNNLRVFREYDPEAMYVIGADTSEGLANGDSSVAVILNAKKFSVDAVYIGKPDTEEYAHILKQLGEEWNEALIVVEDNNHGMAVLNELKKDYYNLYYRKQFDEVAQKTTKKLGWRTTTRTKPIMIQGLKEAMKDHLFIDCLDILNEMTTFIYDENNKMGGQVGTHDDCVMALACAVQGYLESDAMRMTTAPEILPRFCVQRAMDELEEEMANSAQEKFFE